MKELIEYIAKSLVDNPEEVSVTELEGEQTTVIELKVAKEDMGKIIGKQGRQTGKNRHGDENYTWCSLDQDEKKICPGDFRVAE